MSERWRSQACSETSREFAEEERYRIADDVVNRLKQRGDGDAANEIRSALQLQLLCTNSHLRHCYRRRY